MRYNAATILNPIHMEAQSPSHEAMERFLRTAEGLHVPQRWVSPNPPLPTLPALKKAAQARRAQGLETVDQSAGDIDDVGQPMNPEFYRWIEQIRGILVSAGHKEFARTDRAPSGYPGHYQQQYPVVTDKLAESLGLRETPHQALQTVSGRAALDFALRGLLARAQEKGLELPPAIILDPLAWSGYQPLAKDLGIEIIQAPVTEGHGLANSEEGLQAALAFAKNNGLAPIAAIPILPSNPTGAGMDREELRRFIESAAERELPVMIDGFYSPLHPWGHQHAIPLGWLEQNLTPEALGHLGVVVGETKVTSSQEKTGSVVWLAPKGHDQIAKTVIGAGMGRLSTTNSYPRPSEAMAAYALHTFPGGIHAAMGPRYVALDRTRAAMRAACDALELPLTIGGSFYGTAALVDSSGQTLIRDAEGRPVEDTNRAIQTLVERFGLVGAPGGMFSSAPEAGVMARLTAAVTLDDVAAVKTIFGQMLEEARRHG